MEEKERKGGTFFRFVVTNEGFPASHARSPALLAVACWCYLIVETWEGGNASIFGQTVEGRKTDQKNDAFWGP